MDIIERYGENAGKIWHLLKDNESLDEERLMNISDMNSEEMYPALGWLAREGKIYKEHDSYHLGSTNLTEKIGKDAGKVWRAIDTLGEIDAPHLSDFLNLSEYDVLCALGWLAREDKIQAWEKESMDPHPKFYLKK